MPFANRIRLPFYLHQPQFPTEAVRFRRADGTTQTLSTVIRKTYRMTTDWLAENAHQRLVIALNHKFVTMEGTRLISNVVLDSEYDISWQDFLDYPLGQATSSVQVSPFDVSNDNCITCTQASQLEAHDDNAGALEEGEVYNFDVVANDHVCCSPAEFSIIWWDLNYIDTVTILNGIVTITMLAQTPSSGGDIKLITYRITCADGSYDDADVYATVTGTLPDCPKPSITGVEFLPDEDNPTSAVIQWTPNLDAFDWSIAVCSDPNNPILEGSDVNAGGYQFDIPGQLNLGTCYTFCVRKDCGVDGKSEWECVQFVTPGGSRLCGEFNITADDGTTDNVWYEYSYKNCAGQTVTDAIQNLTTVQRCMQADSFTHEPVYFAAGPYVDYAYIGICSL